MIIIKLYLISIVIWMIMIYGTAYLFEEKIKENGWFDLPKSKKNPWLMLFFMSAIPIIRVLFLLSVIIMASMTKEQVDEWKNKNE